MLLRSFDGRWRMSESQWQGHVEHGCSGLIESDRSESRYQWIHCCFTIHDPYAKHRYCTLCVQKRMLVEHNDRCCL
jgi:hypothetical protein